MDAGGARFVQVLDEVRLGRGQYGPDSRQERWKPLRELGATVLLVGQTAREVVRAADYEAQHVRSSVTPDIASEADVSGRAN